MYLQEHEKHSIDLFTKPWTEVHKWLDEFAGSKKYGMRYRKVRHHQAGIEQAVELFGEEARAPARQHIIDDLSMEGWKTGEHNFPRDSSHYVKMGLF